MTTLDTVMPKSLEAALGEALRRGYVAAYRFLGSAEEARDVCQEAAARALSARESYDPARPFYPWFYRILKNLCIDRVKQRQKEGPGEADTAQSAASGQTSAEYQILESERSRAISRAIEALPDDLRELIELRHFQDLSYQRMAEILECPIGTVMSRLYRARRALREKLLSDPAFVGHRGKGA